MAREFNVKNAYVFFITTEAQNVFNNAEIDKTNAKYLGICQSESGFKIASNENVEDSAGKERLVSYKAELDVKVITKLTDVEITAIDNKEAAVLFIDANGVSVPDDAADMSDAGVVLPVTPKGVLLAPMIIHIEEEEKFGAGKIVTTTIKASLVARTKEQIRKTTFTIASI